MSYTDNSIESEAVEASDDRATVLIEHLKQIHVNRPAFIDVLTKLK